MPTAEFLAKLISRKDAHEKGLARFFTGVECKNGHVSERYVSTGGCIACLTQYRDRFSRHSPTLELTKWRTPEMLLVPVGLDEKQLRHLAACMQLWVVQWAQHKGVPLTDNQKGLMERLGQNQLTAAT